MDATTMPRSQLQKRWTLKSPDEHTVSELYKSLRIHSALCKLLVERNVTTYDAAKAFFRPSLEHLHDPFLMKGMEQAVSRINDAIDWNERILIFGDYDVDGTTAVAVVYSFLKKLHKANLQYYIPHRYKEGYGLSKQGIDFAHSNGFTLIITLDCGIRSTDLVDYAQKLGIDVIICDHHLPDEHLPKARAILNPKQPGCTYPYKELSGCGIGYKLISALAQVKNIPSDEVNELLDLVATSIAADIVPMDGENRILSYFGLQKANENPCKAIAKLKEIAGVNRAMNVSDLVFVIGPRVNAAGRIDDATRAVDMFVAQDIAETKAIAEELQQNNFERKAFDKNTTIEAYELLQGDVHNHTYKTTVLYKPNWHKGVVGIVASRLIDHFHRPTIILTQGQDNKITGSARSVAGFNIYNAIYECREYLDSFGGHNFAAGVTLEEKNLKAFKEKFEQVVSSTIDPNHLIPELEIDAEIKLKDVKPAFYNILRQFAPFGPGNLRPVFLTKRVYNYRGQSRIVKDTHIKLVVHQYDGISIDGIGFGIGNKLNVVEGGPFDIVYTIDENNFQGQKSLQLKVLDIRPA